MILEELVLHNFGIYRGRHSVDLRPEPGRPVILVGAMNGSGKTTMLDALQLVLYGKLARCSNRGTLAYDSFLRQSINRTVERSEGAALELQFRHATEHGEETVRVHRSWRAVGKGVREVVEVFRDGKLDPVYTEHWYEHVEEFVPPRLSNLFFFDGEQIEYFADAEKSSDLLRTGMHALLGLDLVEQLRTDLDVVAQRRMAAKGCKEAAGRVEQVQDQVAQLEAELHPLVAERGTLQTELDSLAKRVRSLTDRYRNEGGTLYDQREALEESLAAAQRRLDRSVHALMELASGAAPLLLIEEEIRRCSVEADTEEAARRNQQLLGDLEERDRAMIEWLGKHHPQGVPEVLYDFLRQDLESRQRRLATAQELGLNAPALHQALAGFGTLRTQVQDAVEAYAMSSETLSAAERQLAALPQPEQIRATAEQLNAAQTRSNVVQSEIEALDERIEQVGRRLKELDERRRRLTREAKLEDFADEMSRRVVDHASLTQETLAEFRTQLTRRHLKHLETLVMESLQTLLHKDRLLERVEIDPDSFQLRLIDASGHELSPQRLSAGERQLLAVSIVWALTKASGRPLPAVIDTPLGRLDGKHRRALVDRYFPEASHQVILLSTDEEIDHRYYARLAPRLARAYEIRYCETERSSVITEGYPWSEAA